MGICKSEPGGWELKETINNFGEAAWNWDVDLKDDMEMERESNP